MRTIAEINADIERTKQEIEDVRGTQTEVYARIVGYYRSVRNWNKGKREEYNHRKMFTPEAKDTAEHLAGKGNCAIETEEPCRCGNAVAPGAFSAKGDEPQVSYELYSRAACPNCPPVKDFCAGSFPNGKIVDVDTEEGFNKAKQKNILSTPTVIFYSETGDEICRAHSVQDIKDVKNALLDIEFKESVTA